MAINPNDSVPLFRQIVAHVRDAIDREVYRPGEALPSLRAFAVELRVNPNTVQRAYDELERSGIVESRRGKGVFVVDRRRLATNSSAEQRLRQSLDRCIAKGLNEHVSGNRIQELFNESLRTNLQLKADRDVQQT